MFQDGMFEIGEIFVTDPVKKTKGLGLNPFVMYKVRTTGLSGAAVERRFNDFHWLYESFLALYPGVIIPQIPDKTSYKRYDDEYIETRRRKLEIFLNRISKHKLLSKTETFEIFLLANDAKLEQTKVQEKASRQSTIAWLSDHMANLNPIDMFDYEKKSEFDERFAKMHTRLKTLLKCTSELSDAAVLMVKAMCESSISLSHMGASLSTWSKDDENETLASKLGKTGVSCTAISIEVGKYAQVKFDKLEEPLQDCVGMLIAAVHAFDRREQARLYFMRCRRDVENHAGGKLTALTLANSFVASKKELYAKAVMDEETAKTRLEMISDMLLREYADFNEARLPEIKKLFFEFSRIQADYYARLHVASQEFATRVEGA